MRGDFSTRLDRPDDGDDAGVVWQQGRVFLDADGNAQTRLAAAWQGTAARDALGAGVLAVPAAEPDGFRVVSATLTPAGVQLQVGAGHAWANGMLARETGGVRTATYLKPPVQSPAATSAAITAGTRDAVVLEVWHETVSAFQEPERLLEPALGGVDTTGRLRVATAYRLLRLGAGMDCDDVPGELGGESAKGRLTVTLLPVGTVGAPCPVEVGGGYTGFEHQLYRVEVAEVSAAGTHFKWSRFNGGLVGRGVFDAGTQRVAIRANLQAIATSGLGSFYLEAVERDPQAGGWRVTYGAPVTLSGDTLVLPATPSFGAVPPAVTAPPPSAGLAPTPNVVFFRLWDGLRPIGDFPAGGTPVELADGIHLEFEAGGAGRYVAEDYWTFAVRAGGVSNEETLLSAELPHAVRVRVSLAVLEWTGGSGTTITAAAGRIHDCRLPFHPLSRLGGCCTFRVGDGVRSHGDYTTIQAAVDALPASGGRVCVLPGLYRETVLIQNRSGVVVAGCGRRSRVTNAPAAGTGAPAGPVFLVRACTGVRLEKMAIDAADGQPGVLVTESAANQGVPRQVSLGRLWLRSGTRSAVEVQGAEGLTVTECDVLMRDVASAWPAVFVRADDARIERNRVQVERELNGVVTPIPTADVAYRVNRGRGGLQLAGGCDRVRVVENLVRGGIGNGITVGSFVERGLQANWTVFGHVAWLVDPDDPCGPCRAGNLVVLGVTWRGVGRRTGSAGSLSEICIERNRILDMGLCGVGVAAFFDLAETDEMIRVDGLSIEGNRIRRCLNRSLAAIPAAMEDSAGYGGIALADVSGLRVCGNLIEDNGRDTLEPVCGIFVLHGEGVEIAHNRITGPTFATGEPARTAKNGRRGGIHLVHTTAPTHTTPLTLSTGKRLEFPVQTAPALRVHDNVVSVPLGPALWARALGAVSVQANAFATRGVRSVGPAPTFVGAAVSITNLGVSNEYHGQFLEFLWPLIFDNGTLVIPRPGLDDAVAGRLVANGNVLFADNQVLLSLLSAEVMPALSSIVITSGDDVGFHDNQCDCDLIDDFVTTHAVVKGASVRVTGNRFKEEASSAAFSARTFATDMNVTANNQATHCILVQGPAGAVVNSPNHVRTYKFNNVCVEFQVLTMNSNIKPNSFVEEP